jgi:phosphoserine phosphatase
MRALKYYGYKTAILSGGFTYFGEYLQKELGIDYVHANQLEIKDGKFHLLERAPGVSIEEIIAKTEGDLIVPDFVPEMQL